jgi:hypothetical protein
VLLHGNGNSSNPRLRAEAYVSTRKWEEIAEDWPSRTPDNTLIEHIIITPRLTLSLRSDFPHQSLALFSRRQNLSLQSLCRSFVYHEIPLSSRQGHKL